MGGEKNVVGSEDNRRRRGEPGRAAVTDSNHQQHVYAAMKDMQLMIVASWRRGSVVIWSHIDRDKSHYSLS